MREELERNLASKIDARVVADVLNAYEGLIQKHRALDAEAALTRAGKFIEHVFRALEFIRTGTAPAEIKSPAATAKQLEIDTKLPESIRILIPRIALAMVYDLRSKRGAVHVKEIDPRGIDVDLAAKAASWIIAELIRLYHVDNENAVRLEMTALTRATFPLLESIDGEDFVSKKVPPRVEIQLLLGRRSGEGATRNQLGKMAKCSAQRVSEAIKSLKDERLVHQTGAGFFHLTGPGEASLMTWLSENEKV
ncbi:MAG: hypothetical protein JWN71_337 [Xanthobacteraceae bacterium]|nr:hypothetical protein [Xanthobacteraceae bacterium]